MDVQLGTYLCYQPQGTFPNIDASLKTRLFTSHLSPKSANNGFEIEAKKGALYNARFTPHAFIAKAKKALLYYQYFKSAIRGSTIIC